MAISSSFSLQARSKFSAKLSASVLSLGLGIPGLIFACIVLCAYGYAAWHPVSRRHMNRVSLRLLAYALVANLIFGIANIIQNTVQSSSAYPSGWCSYLVWMTQLSLIFSAAMFFSVAFNLQLVLVHHINGQRMERYYIIGATAFTLASTVPPYAAGQFGWSENARSCWYCNPDPEKVKQWILGTDTAPMITLAVGELIAFVMILGYFVSYELFWRQTRVDSDGTYFEDIPTPRSPIVMYKNIIASTRSYPASSTSPPVSSILESPSRRTLHTLRVLRTLDFYLAAYLCIACWRSGIRGLTMQNYLWVTCISNCRNSNGENI
ncbi:hypothetical protein B0H14DRAFT_2868808 [Mycena olivaceomarginata]|nr:hypothetical protein B0H14DRAFT_2868808 [Mycena olivaceomarginata]